MDVCYGIPVNDSEDPYITRAETALDGIAKAGIPGSFLVDMLPWMKYIPSWFPGASFQRKAAIWKLTNEQVCKIPFNVAKKQVVRPHILSESRTSP